MEILALRLVWVIALILFLLEPSHGQNDYWQATGPLGGDYIFTLAVDSSGRLYAGTSDRGVWSSSDKGTTWNGSMDSSGPIHVIAFPAGGPAYIGGSMGLLQSTNGGMVWSPALNLYSEDLAVDSNNTTLVATPNGIYRSTITGIWNFSGLFLSGGARSVHFGQNGYAFAGSGDGRLFRSSDSGATWIVTTFTSSYISDFLLLPNGDVLLGAVEGLFRSTDNGESWFDAGLSGLQVLSIVMNPLGHFFAGTGINGVYRSTDDGSSWEPVTSGLTTSPIFALVVDRDGFIYAGNGDGVFRSMQPTTGIKDSKEGLPTDISLAQNYPNPFNASTVISFTLHRTMMTSIGVYNLLGLRVFDMEMGSLAPGEHIVYLALTNLGTGVYYYRLEAEKQIIEKPMLLIK